MSELWDRCDIHSDQAMGWGCDVCRDELARRIAELEARAERAEADVRRMDALQNFIEYIGPLSQFPMGEHGSLRDAIDAAMRAEGEDGME